MRQFKRCQGNRFCEQSLEQGGRKWVVSRRMMTGKNEEVIYRFPSPSATCKKLLVVPSWHNGKCSDLPSQIPTTAGPNQLDQAKKPMRHHTPNDIHKISPKSLDAHRAMRPAPTQSKAGLVDTNLERSETTGDDHIPVLAEDSAIDPPTSSRPANSQEAPTFPSSHHKENTAGDSTSVFRKQKSPEQLERRRKRRRRAQQIRRMMNSDKQSEELTPRVFMQWEKSEVQRLTYKQELALKSAHQAELQKQELRLKSAHQAELQKQELRLKSAHQMELQGQELRLYLNRQAELQGQELRLYLNRRAELQNQRLTLNSNHQADLQKQEVRLKSAHQVEQFASSRQRSQKNIQHILRMLDICKRMADDILCLSHPAARLRKALSLLDDGVFLALNGEDLHCE